MISSSKNGSKDKPYYDVELSELKISNLKHAGETVSISWKKGKKFGVTKTTLAKDHKASWDEKISFHARGGASASKDDDSKKLLLVLSEGGKKVGKLEVQLGRHLTAGAVIVAVAEPLVRDLAGSDVDVRDPKKKEKDKSDSKAPRLQFSLRVTPVPVTVTSASPGAAPPPLRRSATDSALRRSGSNESLGKKEKKEKKEKPADDGSDKEKKEKKEKKDKEGAHRRSRSRQVDTVELTLTTASPSTLSPAAAEKDASGAPHRGHRRGASLSIATVNSSLATEPLKSPDSKHRLRVNSNVAQALMSQEKEIEALRQQLETRQQMEADEKFLVENALYFAEPVYSHEVPVSAYVLFRALLQWRAFHDGSVLPQTIADALDKLVQKHSQPRAPPNLQVYWLACAAMLLHLLKKQLHISGSGGGGELASLRSFEGRLLGFVNTLFGALVRGCEAQLDAVLVPAVLEQPDISGAPSTKPAVSVEAVAAVLQTYLGHLNDGFVFRSLSAQFFRQVFYYMNARLLNALVEKRGYSRCANGIQIKMQVSQILEWAARSPLSESAREQLDGIKQAADVLVVNKPTLLEANVRREVCPALNNAQLYQLLSVYSPDEFDPEPIDPAVLRGINALDKSFGTSLLDAAYQFPLVSSDWSLRKDIDFGKVEIPSVLLSRPGFAFLQTNAQLSSSTTGTW